MRKTQLFVSIIALLLVASSLLTTVSASANYTAMIVQGNTSDVNDCKVVFEALKDVPNGNSYTIFNRGWHYNNGDSYHNYDMWQAGHSGDPEYALACEQNLIDAGTHDVLYWSGHGGSNPIRLNVHPSNAANDYGPGNSQQPAFSIASTLKVTTSNWANTCEWDKNSNLKVAIFACCLVVDNSDGDCMYLVRAMKASNVRVIAGYHTTSPTHPADIRIAERFFSNTTNGGVAGGESIRSSWQTANELSGSYGWAVLCYKEGGNQYYRMPGFPGKTYSEPSNDATVYRFWSSYSDSTGGQPMTPTSISSISNNALPLEITVAVSDVSPASADGNNVLTVYREMYDGNQFDLDESTQRNIAENYLNEKHTYGLESIATVSCEEMSSEIGAVPETAVVVGKTFCYSNHYNGIRMVDNFYKVATDANGVYFTIDKWKDIVAYGSETFGTASVISAEDARLAVVKPETDIMTNAELVYVPINETTYRLCYAITTEDSFIYYVDCATGVEVEAFIS